MIEIGHHGGVFLMLVALLGAPEGGHYLAGMAIGIPREAMRIVLGMPRSHVALRDEGGWIDPGDHDRYGAAFRGYVPDRSLRPCSFAYVAGGWIGEAGAVLVLVLVVGRLDAGAPIVPTAVFWSLIATVLYLLIDLAETRRNRRAAGDASSLWTVSPAGTVALLASVVSVKLAAIGLPG